MLGKDPGPAGSPHLVTRPPDALQSPGDGARGFDEDHEVDGIHVDAEFQRRCGNYTAQDSGLQPVFDDQPLFPRQ